MSQGRSIEEDGTEKPLSRIPPLFSTTSLKYYFGKQAFIEFYMVAAALQDEISDRDKKDPRIPKGGTPGWWTLNLRGTAVLSSFAKLSFNLENMFDVEYKYHGSGVLSPGISARITLDLSI